jgi:hypothetical protein
MNAVLNFHFYSFQEGPLSHHGLSNGDNCIDLSSIILSPRDREKRIRKLELNGAQSISLTSDKSQEERLIR